MRVEQFTRDHVLVVNAAFAYRRDEPTYARSLLAQCEDAETAAVELVGLLMEERVQQHENEGKHR